MPQQERWEELEGYSPSTPASNIAAPVCAADKWADPTTAQSLLEYADFLDAHLEAWCVTTQGTLLPDVSRHYVRILPTHVKGGARDFDFPEDPNVVQMTPWNQTYNARDVVDASFLELVRDGVRGADDPITVNFVKVVDAIIRKDLPQGPGFYRYNHDGYGQRDLGQDWYVGCSFGVGHPWRLLTGPDLRTAIRPAGLICTSLTFNKSAQSTISVEATQPSSRRSWARHARRTTFRQAYAPCLTGLQSAMAPIRRWLRASFDGRIDKAASQVRDGSAV